MAPSDAAVAPPGRLDADDLDDALERSAEAGWNQVAADWLLMLRLGQALAVRDGGRVVATALALPYPPAFGWVSMVLVHEPYRRRGIATRLVEAAAGILEGAGLVPVLDATPAGSEVYGRMGFRPLGALTRWRGRGRPIGEGPEGDRHIPGPLRMTGIDRAAFGADRSGVLDDLAARPAPVALADGDDGYLLSRAGRTATQLGPLVARDPATAAALLAAGLDRVEGPVLVDVPDGPGPVHDLLVARGLVPERPFVRMARGRAAPFGDPALVHAIAGPELG